MADIRGRTIYLVEDDDALRRMTSRMLQASGCIVRDFASGESFLEEAESAEPGCVLLDIRMPGMSGLRVQELLVERGVTMSVIMLTGTADIADAVLAMKAGAADFIQKPFCRETVLAALEAAFQRLDLQLNHAARTNDAARRLAALAPRERQVLEKLAKGLQNKVVAHELGLSARTVEAYRATLMRKLGVRSLAEALRISVEAGGAFTDDGTDAAADVIAPDAATNNIFQSRRAKS